MKVEEKIPGDSLERVLSISKEEGTSVDALADAPKHSAFKLRDASMRGEGLQPEFVNATWEQIRAVIYEGRGG